MNCNQIKLTATSCQNQGKKPMKLHLPKRVYYKNYSVEILFQILTGVTHLLYLMTAVTLTNTRTFTAY